MDDLFNKYMNGLTYEEIVQYMWQSSGASSMLKGMFAELHFTKFTDKINSLGEIWQKIPDQDKTRRYDFLVNFLKLEVKVLTPNSTVDIGFKDKRDVILPSGCLWRTRCRKISESFDFLVLNLVNFEGYTNQDFICVPFSSLPAKILQPKDLERKRLRKTEDRDWVKENYLDTKLDVDFKNAVSLEKILNESNISFN